jgi:large subunit ribosomal protein L28
MVSDALGKSVSFRVSTNAIRTVEKSGGIDAYLLSTKDENLSLNATRVKRAIKVALASN